MSIQPFAVAGRAGFIATVALAAAAATLTVPAPAAAAKRSSTPMLAQGIGMRGHPSVRVREVQRALERHGYAVGAPGVDGRFGPLTAAAVRRLQSSRGLAVDGVVGARTRKALGLAHRTARPAHRRSHARAKTTAKHAPKPAATPKPTPAASPPSASNELSRESRRSHDAVVAIVIFWAAIAGFAALALGAAWRRVARTRQARVRRARMCGLGTSALAGATEPDAGAQTSQGPSREPVIGYVSVAPDATSEQRDRSAAAIVAAAEGSEWDLLEIVCDRGDGRPLERPGLARALGRIADGEAGTLVVSDLLSFSRSNGGVGVVLEWFRDNGATLVALDLPLDTRTPVGRQVENTAIAAIALGRANAALSGEHASDGRTDARANGAAGPPAGRRLAARDRLPPVTRRG